MKQYPEITTRRHADGSLSFRAHSKAAALWLRDKWRAYIELDRALTGVELQNIDHEARANFVVVEDTLKNETIE